MKHGLLASAVLLPSLWCGAASANVAYELKIGSIAGSSTAAGHVGWIDVGSFSWGVTNTGSTGGGTGSGGKPVFQDLGWTQGIDTSIVPIFLGVANGTHYPTATLDVVRAGNDVTTFFEMVFGTAVLTGLNVVGGGDLPMASASLDYNQVTMRYRAQRADGSYGTWIEGTFSLVNNSVVFGGDANVLTGLFESGGAVNLSGVGSAASPTAVPEPGSWALMIGGLGVLGWATRRRVSNRS